jgi:hypothetical protein
MDGMEFLKRLRNDLVWKNIPVGALKRVGSHRVKDFAIRLPTPSDFL